MLLRGGGERESVDCDRLDTFLLLHCVGWSRTNPYAKVPAESPVGKARRRRGGTTGRADSRCFWRQRESAQRAGADDRRIDRCVGARGAHGNLYTKGII